ncbi:MAG: cobaltochelatase subunit CobN [Cyanobacteria bacterium MAG CAR3_bin_5]|nr:cobaltochelatase subunit CobN [Cyanobacteria bacterium MAG CAR3_bin_5]
MHRLAVLPGVDDGQGGALLVEQEPAPILLLTTSDTDLATMATVLERSPQPRPMRGLNVAALAHPAVVDHYLRTTVAPARVVLLRLLGGRSVWSYGLERLQEWQAAGGCLVVLDAVAPDPALESLSSTAPELTRALGDAFRWGGTDNLAGVAAALQDLAAGIEPQLPRPAPLADPLPHDWRQDDQGPAVGVLFYRALAQAGDVALVDAALASLRAAGMAPKALLISGLRTPGIQSGIVALWRRQGVKLVLTTTGFAAVGTGAGAVEDAATLWDELDCPVLQMVCSSGSREAWRESSVGLGPRDLGMQVVLPELDGRLLGRVVSFKEAQQRHPQLDCPLFRYTPVAERLTWCARWARAWLQLAATPAEHRRLAIVLANYPTRNSHLANGVGLDTPASVAACLGWLAAAGYGVTGALPRDGDHLIHQLTMGRSNDPRSLPLAPMAHLPLAVYEAWFARLPAPARRTVLERWGPPGRDEHLEADGFAIHGSRFGAVVVLIQPSRGYEQDPQLSYHSPDLPPTHHYLATYHWLQTVHRADGVIHFGKHGNLEWLPGKGVGLSANCFPDLALGPLPHLYPFIVNDPGEGAQAKRRSQALILDHLTPPLARAGLHGQEALLEQRLDEYWQALQLGSDRAPHLRRELDGLLAALHLEAEGDLDQRLEQADGYLCELKEAQIRTGLHRYGMAPEPQQRLELLLALARCPRGDQPGLTQAMALDLGLTLDPWTSEEEAALSPQDRQRLNLSATARCAGDAMAMLEDWAMGLLKGEATAPGPRSRHCLEQVAADVAPRLDACPKQEQQSLLRGLAGGRIPPGPAGAPTRGRLEVLPTGRNFYSIDLRGLPTEAAWDLGRRAAELLLEHHEQQQGEPLRHLAMSVWGTATMRNGGDEIAQALALMGVRPVWDGQQRRVVDLEVIPLPQLNRPRVDVTLRISGFFRDAFPNLVDLMHRAGLLLRQATGTILGQIYGSAPGAYGAGLQGLMDSGAWESATDLATAFLNWSQWRYSSNAAGELQVQQDRDGLCDRLRQVDGVLHNQDNREHDLLDSDDYYQFQGGLAATVTQLRGQTPALWFGDHARPQRPRIHRLARELDKVVRSRLLNPRWLEGMRRHGYRGGFEMSASLNYLFAYDASTGAAPDWAYGAIARQWLLEPEGRAALNNSNPWALQEMGERLLEAHRRGLWKDADKEQIQALEALVRQVDADLELGQGGRG